MCRCLTRFFVTAACKSPIFSFVKFERDRHGQIGGRDIPADRRIMLLARLGCAAFHGPMLGRVLARGLSTPSTAHAAAVVVPLVSKLEPYDAGGRSYGARLGLGMATAGALLLAQPDDAVADCMPPAKRKQKAAPTGAQRWWSEAHVQSVRVL
jgi:hypothetical protein